MMEYIKNIMNFPTLLSIFINFILLFQDIAINGLRSPPLLSDPLGPDGWS